MIVYINLQRCLGQMVLLAGPGVLISTFWIGTLLKVMYICVLYGDREL